MTQVVRDTHGQVWHEVDSVAESGDHVTVCELVILLGRSTIREDDLVSCKSCRDLRIPKSVVIAVPRVKAKAKGRPLSGRPQWRVAKTSIKELEDALTSAHRCIAAAKEWALRGGEGQFINASLDQAHLAVRFLTEILVVHDRIDPPMSEDD